MKELHELIKYLKDNGYEHLKINPDLLVGIIEYFASKQEPKQCNITDVSQQRELLLAYEIYNSSEYDKKNNMEYLENLVDTYLANNCG